MDGLLVVNNTDRQTSGPSPGTISWLLLYYRTKPAEQSIHDNSRNFKLIFNSSVGSSFGGGLSNMRSDQKQASYCKALTVSK